MRLTRAFAPCRINFVESRVRTRVCFVRILFALCMYIRAGLIVDIPFPVKNLREQIRRTPINETKHSRILWVFASRMRYEDSELLQFFSENEITSICNQLDEKYCCLYL